MPARKKLTCISTPRLRDPVTGQFKSTCVPRSRDPVTGQFRRAWARHNRSQANMTEPTPRGEIVNLRYMRDNLILKHYVFCHECERQGRYCITGQDDERIDVRFELTE